jgi:catechol 2,3-dioxygenase-like lactoylglutathione lyase family enzyme
MTVQRMDHVGIIVNDLADAVAFFAQLGLELQGETPVEGDWVDRVVGLEGVRAQIVMLQTPDGHGRIELAKFHTPSADGATSARRRTLRASATSRSPLTTSRPSSLAS